MQQYHYSQRKNVCYSSTKTVFDMSNFLATSLQLLLRFLLI